MADNIYKHLDGQGVAELRRFKLNPIGTPSGDPNTPNPIASEFWYNAVTNRFRYQDNVGPKTVATLDDIPSSSSPIIVGTTQPATVDGTVLWNNTNVNQRGFYYFDVDRNRWLTNLGITLVYGEDGADNNNLGGPGMTAAGNFSGYNVPYECTITGITMACRDFSGNTPSKFITLRQRIGDGNPTDIQDFTIVRAGGANNDPGYFSNMNLNIRLGAEASGQRQLYFFAQGAGGSALDIFAKMIVQRSVEPS